MKSSGKAVTILLAAVVWLSRTFAGTGAGVWTPAATLPMTEGVTYSVGIYGGYKTPYAGGVTPADSVANRVTIGAAQFSVALPGDATRDGTVDGADLNTVLSNYNQHVGVGAAVPEPSTFVLLGMGAVALAGCGWRRRRRTLPGPHCCARRKMQRIALPALSLTAALFMGAGQAVASTITEAEISLGPDVNCTPATAQAIPGSAFTTPVPDTVFNPPGWPTATIHGKGGYEGGNNRGDIHFFSFATGAGGAIFDIDNNDPNAFTTSLWVSNANQILVGAGALAVPVDPGSLRNPGSSSGPDDFVGVINLSAGTYYVAISGWPVAPNGSSQGTRTNLLRPDGAMGGVAISNGGTALFGGYVGPAGSHDYTLHISLQDPVATLLPGDANMDGTVDGADLNIVLSNYNQTGMAWAQGDFNGDGTVDGADLNTVLSNYNQHVNVGQVGNLSYGAAVPEPSTIALVGIGAVATIGLFWRRKRRRRLVKNCIPLTLFALALSSA